MSAVLERRCNLDSTGRRAHACPPDRDAQFCEPSARRAKKAERVRAQECEANYAQHLIRTVTVVLSAAHRGKRFRKVADQMALPNSTGSASNISLSPNPWSNLEEQEARRALNAVQVRLTWFPQYADRALRSEKRQICCIRPKWNETAGKTLKVIPVVVQMTKRSAGLKRLSTRAREATRSIECLARARPSSHAGACETIAGGAG